MPTKKRSPRSPSGLKITGLSPTLIEEYRQRVGYRGAADRQFFEDYVWWWIPLEQILGPKHENRDVPSPKNRRFLPQSLFSDIRRAEETKSIPDLIEYWFRDELGARLEGEPVHNAWPAFGPLVDVAPVARNRFHCAAAL